MEYESCGCTPRFWMGVVGPGGVAKRRDYIAYRSRTLGDDEKQVWVTVFPTNRHPNHSPTTTQYSNGALVLRLRTRPVHTTLEAVEVTRITRA